ncbi:MAG: hypothetical protein AAF711_11370 [Planctomycetota bacterium]
MKTGSCNANKFLPEIGQKWALDSIDLGKIPPHDPSTGEMHDHCSDPDAESDPADSHQYE